MLNNPDLLSLFLGLEPADAPLPTPRTLSQGIEALGCTYGLGLAVAVAMIADAEGAGQEAGACAAPTRPALTRRAP